MIDKRNEILDAALSIITEEGFHNLTLARVFNKANTGSGTFYYYFKNKNELVKALFERCQKKEESLLYKYKDTSLSLDERIEIIISEILQAYQTNPRELGFVHWYCNNGIEEAFAKTTRTSPSVKAIYSILRDGQKDGKIPESAPLLPIAKVIRSSASTAFWAHSSKADPRSLDEISLSLAKKVIPSFFMPPKAD